jgi:ribosomal protein S27E
MRALLFLACLVALPSPVRAGEPVELSCVDCHHTWTVPSEPKPNEVSCPACAVKVKAITELKKEIAAAKTRRDSVREQIAVAKVKGSIVPRQWLDSVEGYERKIARAEATLAKLQADSAGDF